MEILLKVVSVLLLLIMVFGTLVACLCAVEHADVLAISEKPIPAHDKLALKRLAKIGLLSGLLVTLCLVLRLTLRGQSFWEMLTSVGIYKIFIVPTFWLISFFTPSKRKKEVRRRAKLRKQKLKAST